MCALNKDNVKPYLIEYKSEYPPAIASTGEASGYSDFVFSLFADSIAAESYYKSQTHRAWSLV
jgi:hypothetical protein